MAREPRKEKTRSATANACSGQARMVNPTTNAVAAPSGESDPLRRPCRLRRDAKQSGKTVVERKPILYVGEDFLQDFTM